MSKLGYGFVLAPVAVNSCMLLLLALALNNLMRRRYPQQHVPTAVPHQRPSVQSQARLPITKRDLDAALAMHDELLDISKDDLEEILLQAQLHAEHRAKRTTVANH